ncbi:MAG: T9SS type A sorting domain-containing protein [Bacteroidia bacterium]
MKLKILFSFLLTVIYLPTAAQSLQIETKSGTIVSGTCVEISGNADDELIGTFHVRNISSNDLMVRLDRIELDVNCSTDHAVCWSICPQSTPSCTQTTLTSVQDVLINAGEVDISLAGHHYPNGNSGYSIYRYIAYDVNNTSDQVYVDITYKHGADNPSGGCTLALNEHQKTSFIISPNPTSEYLNVEVVNGRNYTLQLINILGKEVLKETVLSNKSINVANLDRGIYVVKITDVTGAEVKTSKIVLE